MIASSRFPVREPFAGGLEAHTHALASHLAERGHEVTVFAAPGSDERLCADPLDLEPFQASDLARSDVAAPPETWMQEHHAYLSLMLSLMQTGPARFDVIHNNSLHHLPVAMSSSVHVPMVTTLHTPPTPWLESALRFADATSRFVAVSRSTADQWRPVVDAGVIRNGVDTRRWGAGPGGDRAVWFGRVVPEKAPHLALDAARLAGIPIDLAGPVFDRAYFAEQIEPRLGSNARYLGHLDTDGLSRLVGSSAVTAVTPAWEEPYGLTAAESMACGTPVAAFARGGLRETIGERAGVLSAPNDVEALAHALHVARGLPRAGVRAFAVDQLSHTRMVDEYEELFDEMTFQVRAA